MIDEGPKTAFGITGEILGAAGTASDDWEKFMALNETYVYLKELQREGAVRETATGGIVYYTSF